MARRRQGQERAVVERDRGLPGAWLHEEGADPVAGDELGQAALLVRKARGTPELELGHSDRLPQHGSDVHRPPLQDEVVVLHEHPGLVDALVIGLDRRVVAVAVAVVPAGE